MNGISVQNVSLKSVIEDSRINNVYPGDVPHVNICLIGDFNHGKTTLSNLLACKKPAPRFYCGCCRKQNVLEVFHTTAKIYKCDGPTNQRGLYCYKSNNTPDEFSEDGIVWKLVRKATLIDIPSHDLFLSLAFSGGIVIDAVILVTAGNKSFPQPQTIQYLTTMKVLGKENLIIVQNKIDLITPKEAAENYKEIKKFVSGTTAESAPIIPISATKGYNLDILCEYIVRSLPIPRSDCVSVPKMSIFHSSDPNRSGSHFETMTGGTLKGTLHKEL